MQYRYYKISPEWAERLKLTRIAVRHPDGWYLVLAPRLTTLPSLLPPDENGQPYSIDGAVEAIGGCIYTQEQALASQRGETAYMMNRTEPDETPARVPVYNLDGSPYYPDSNDNTDNENNDNTDNGDNTGNAEGGES